MPTGVYNHPPQCGFQKGMPPWNKNKKTGLIPKSAFKKGHTSWSKNKKLGFTPEKAFKKGNIPWNKNKKCPQLAEKNSHWWKGGKIKNTQGYILIYKPEHPFCNGDKYVYEHRLEVEKQIGRYLTPKEVGHHRGAKDDNRPHMLMAFVNKPAHTKFHKDPNSVKSSEIVFDGSLL